jgi:HD superfamily phosphodiesterase
MTATLKRIAQIAREYYEKPNPVINWNEWVLHGHNEVVDYWVTELAKKYTFDVEAVRIAAHLHDISYAWTSKNDPTQEHQALKKAREILLSEGFEENRIKFIVDDIIAGHGMHDGQEPDLVEAKVLATADAMAHLTTDFYLVMDWNHYLFENKNSGDYRKWVLKKLERDFYNKIFFDDFREIAKPYYEALKTVFELPSTY